MTIEISDATLQQPPVSRHILAEYKHHCEYLNFSIEEDTEFSIYCNHRRRDPFRLIAMKNGVGVMSQISWRISPRFASDITAVYIYTNELNCDLVFTKACVRDIEHGKPTLVMTSVLEGSYDRQAFAIFLENIDEDMKRFHAHPKTPQVFGRPADV